MARAQHAVGAQLPRGALCPFGEVALRREEEEDVRAGEPLLPRR